MDGHEHYSAVTDPVKLDALLKVLRDRGVLSFRDGDLEITLTPSYAEPTAHAEADDADTNWDGSFGLNVRQARAAGLAR